MPIRFQYFDSVAGDRIYNAEEFSQHLRRLATNGFTPNDGEELQIFPTDPASLSVEIGLGSAWVQGRFVNVYDNREVLTVTQTDRIYRVVVRLDVTESNRNITIVLKEGTSSSPPSLTRDENVYELSLAQINVPSGATAITGANITDERHNASLCGFSRHLGSLPINGGTLRGEVNFGNFNVSNFLRLFFSDRSNNSQLWGFTESGVNGNLLLAEYDSSFNVLGVRLAIELNTGELFVNQTDRVWHDGNTDGMVSLSKLANDVLDFFLPRSGGDMTGAVTFNNNVGLFGRDTAGNQRAMLLLNNFNNVQFGNFINPSLITGPNVTSLQFMTTDFVTRTVWHDANIPACRLVKSSAQSIPSGQNSTVTWETVSFNTQLNADVTNNRVVIQRAGLYDLYACVSFSTNNTGQRIVIILLNGSEISRVNQDTATNLRSTIKDLTTRSLNVGDVITVQAWQNSGGNLDLLANSDTQLIVKRIGNIP